MARKKKEQTMTSRDFCYWLQGLFEVGQPVTLNAMQVKQVKAHLAMVFAHEIDPSFGGPDKQEILDAIHNAGAHDPHMLIKC